MNLRYAAALSLTGVAPRLAASGAAWSSNDTSAPLVTWFRAKTVYSSREECEKVKSKSSSAKSQKTQKNKGSLNARKLASV